MMKGLTERGPSMTGLFGTDTGGGLGRVVEIEGRVVQLGIEGKKVVQRII